MSHAALLTDAIPHPGRGVRVDGGKGGPLEHVGIYAKLGARDRSSAVPRARELRLLAAGRTR